MSKLGKHVFKEYCLLFSTGYLLREIKKADISLPESDMNPVSPSPKHIMTIMVMIPFIVSISAAFFCLLHIFIHLITGAASET